jgi:hypothetical protein
VYTQPIGWLFVFVQAIYFVVFVKKHKGAFLGWFISTIFVGLYYIPQHSLNRMLMKVMEWHLITPASITEFLAFTLRRFFGAIMHFTSCYYFHYVSVMELFKNPVQAGIFLLMAGIPALLLLLGVIKMVLHRRPIYLFLVLLFLAPVSLIWMDGTSPRYYIMGAAPFLIICGVGIEYLNRKLLRILCWCAIGVISVLALLDIYTSPASTFSPENPRYLSKYVQEMKEPGDVVYYIGRSNGTHTWKYYNPEPGAFISGTPFWSEHFYGLRLSVWVNEYLQYENFSIRIDPLLERYNTVWMVMQSSRHDVIEKMTDDLKEYYDLTLHYNQDWLALAEIRSKYLPDQTHPDITP